jgi:hypothetical protein
MMLGSTQKRCGLHCSVMGFTNIVNDVSAVYVINRSALVSDLTAWSALKMVDRVKWGSEACLCLRSEMRDAKPLELFRGQIVDAVYLALARPEKERPRLFISHGRNRPTLSWAAIVALSEEPDFPIII